MTAIIGVTRERFLLAIAKEIVPERIEEIHFFQAIRQGGVESGVAVIAATLPSPPAEPVAEDAAEIHSEAEGGQPRGLPLDEEDAAALEPDEAMPAPRYTVFSAQYRLVLKGADRGHWESTVVEEADAPLLTVGTVVRGVQRRSGDVEDPERMDGEAVRDVLRRASRPPSHVLAAAS